MTEVHQPATRTMGGKIGDDSHGLLVYHLESVAPARLSCCLFLFYRFDYLGNLGSTPAHNVPVHDIQRPMNNRIDTEYPDCLVFSVITLFPIRQPASQSIAGVALVARSRRLRLGLPAMPASADENSPAAEADDRLFRPLREENRV